MVTPRHYYAVCVGITTLFAASRAAAQQDEAGIRGEVRDEAEVDAGEVDAGEIDAGEIERLAAADAPAGVSGEHELEEIVVTASRRRQSRMETSVAVERVDAARVNETMPVTVADVAAQTPGVALNSPAGVYFRNPSIRGLGGRRVIMLIDGQRIDTEKTVGVTGYFVNVGNVQRVEVLRGPGSVLYGSDALGGVINVLSVSPLDQQGFAASTRTTVASNNNEIANWSTVGWANGGWGLRVSTLLREAKDYRTGDGELIENSFYEDQGITLDVARVLGEGQSLRIKGNLYRGSPIGKAVSPEDDEKLRRVHFPNDEHHAVQATYEAFGLTGALERLAVSAYVSRTLRDQRAELFSSDWSRVVTRTDKSGDFLNVGVSPLASFVLDTDNVLTVGLDGFYKHLQQDQTVRAFVPGIDTPAEATVPIDGAEAMMAGVFVQDEHRFDRQWRAVAGARGDVVHLSFLQQAEGTTSSTDQAVTGNTGVVYQPSDTASISFNVGRAFRAPTLKEKFVQQAACKGVLCGRPDVKPEKTWNFDFGIRGSVGALSYEIYDFLILADDFIALMPSDDPVCDYDYMNVKRSVLYGGETRWSYVFDLSGSSGLELWTTVAAVAGEDRSTGSPLPAIPPMRLGSGFRLAKRSGKARTFYAEADVHYSFAQDRIASEQNIKTEMPTGAYAVSNAGIGFRTKPEGMDVAVDTFLRVTNLADTAYRDHMSTVEAMGRNVKLGFGMSYD